MRSRWSYAIRARNKLTIATAIIIPRLENRKYGNRMAIWSPRLGYGSWKPNDSLRAPLVELLGANAVKIVCERNVEHGEFRQLCVPPRPPA